MMSQPIIVSFVLQKEQLQTSEREKLSKNRELADAQQQLKHKVSRHCDFQCEYVFLTAGDRADKGRGDYQKRAAADSRDEMES